MLDNTFTSTQKGDIEKYRIKKIEKMKLKGK